ncbi:MAG: hypothetical protein A4S14_10640 [Proteobacteria bacterium SG_bin9]|nr:MAG: hypothetical protein A4S14_10640 [Proteobacteria bacterium SG_bin9]
MNYVVDKEGFMPGLPVAPHFKEYRGAKPHLQRRAAEEFRTAQRIADYVNAQIANDPDEVQQIIFGFVAIELGVTVEQVQRALPGGSNGWTFRVDEYDRKGLERYKRDT